MTNRDRLRILQKLAQHGATRYGRAVSDWTKPFLGNPEAEEDLMPTDPWLEPDWEELDRRANAIVARYAVVSGAWNVLPSPLDLMGVTATFAKMATELAGVYQVIVSSSRARQMGWAIATTTSSVLGVAFAGSKLVKFIPGGGWLASLLLQAPIVGAVAWAAGDALKDYFKQTRRGVDPGLNSLKELFSDRLHFKIKASKNGANPDAAASASAGKPEKNGAAAPADATPAHSPTDVVEKIAGLHELLRQGAITQEEFDKTKATLLSQM